MLFGLARDTAGDPLICSDVSDGETLPTEAVEEHMAAGSITAAIEDEEEDPFGLGWNMDDDEDGAPPVPSSSSAGPANVVIKREPGLDDVFPKRLKVENMLIELDD